MASPLSQEIHRQLARYLAGELTRAQFRRWFEPVLWQVDAASDPAADALAFEIESYDAEYSGGFIDEAELKQQLQDVAATPAPIRIQLDEPPRRRLPTVGITFNWPIRAGANLHRVERGTAPTRHLRLPRQSVSSASRP